MFSFVIDQSTREQPGSQNGWLWTRLCLLRMTQTFSTSFIICLLAHTRLQMSASSNRPSMIENATSIRQKSSLYCSATRSIYTQLMCEHTRGFILAGLDSLSKGMTDSFRFQLWSDLHLEICELQLPEVYVARAPYLLLAGDIGVPGSTLYCALLHKVAPAYEKVFVIAGNHEYHCSSLKATDDAIQSMCAAAGPNIFYLNNAVHDIPALGCRVVGTTLWSRVKNYQRVDVSCFISDYRLIDCWDVTSQNACHSLNVDFLRTEIARATDEGVQLVIMTHHAPLESGVCRPQQEGNALSSAFQTDLSELMGPPVAVWCFGHTHYCSSQHVKGTHVVSNQRGYVRYDSAAQEDTCFDLTKVIETPTKQMDSV